MFEIVSGCLRSVQGIFKRIPRRFRGSIERIRVRFSEREGFQWHWGIDGYFKWAPSYFKGFQKNSEAFQGVWEHSKEFQNRFKAFQEISTRCQGIFEDFESVSDCGRER